VADEEWEEDDEDDYGDDDEDTTIPCPYCHRPIYEDAERCPYCDKYITEEDAVPAKKPWWILIGVGIALYVVVRWIVG
jgi:hypothetical protein